MKHNIIGLFLMMIHSVLPVLGQTISSDKSYIKVNTIKTDLSRDTLPPFISLITPSLQEGGKYTADDEELTLIGEVTDESGIKSLFINTVPTDLSEDHIFTSKIQLETGNNKISFIAIDNAGNYKELNFEMSYTPVITFRVLAGSGKYYALLIGNNDYQDPDINDLDNPISDAENLYDVLLSKYSFEEGNVTLLKNAKREQIINELDKLSIQITPGDNLLLFYAGHGWWDEEADIGYWLPIDARQSGKAAWFRNSTLCDYLKEIKSKHTLLIADACFAGSIFNTRSAFHDASKAINKLYELPSRKAMTSGTFTEVPDRSTFVRYLIDRLAANTENYLSSEQLFSSFRIAVINNSDVIPQYGEIRNVGDEGGDFIFIRK